MNTIRGLLSLLLSCRSRCRMLVLWAWMSRAATPRRRGAAIPEFMCALFLVCVCCYLLLPLLVLLSPNLYVPCFWCVCVLLLVIAMTSFAMIAMITLLRYGGVGEGPQGPQITDTISKTKRCDGSRQRSTTRPLRILDDNNSNYNNNNNNNNNNNKNNNINGNDRPGATRDPAALDVRRGHRIY